MSKILLKTAAVVLCVGAMATQSLAETMQGTYINGNLGVSQFPRLNFKDSGNNSLSLSSKTGLVGGLALGSQNNGLRMELAANYWENRIKSATFSPSLGSNLYPYNGTNSITLAMLNGYYDFNSQMSFTPYLGLGLGAARFRSDTMLNSLNKARANYINIAYQGILGATWDVAPCVKANIDYRYVLAGPQKISVSQPLSSRDLRGNYQNHRVSLGLTYYVY